MPSLARTSWPSTPFRYVVTLWLATFQVSGMAGISVWCWFITERARQIAPSSVPAGLDEDQHKDGQA